LQPVEKPLSKGTQTIKIRYGIGAAENVDGFIVIRHRRTTDAGASKLVLL